jgi:hypothetical protein
MRLRLRMVSERGKRAELLVAMRESFAEQVVGQPRILWQHWSV